VLSEIAQGWSWCLAEIDQGLVARIAEKHGEEVAGMVVEALAALAQGDPEPAKNVLGFNDCREEILRLGVEHGLDPFEVAPVFDLDLSPRNKGRIPRKEVPIGEEETSK
jgi:hypothetical protein